MNELPSSRVKKHEQMIQPSSKDVSSGNTTYVEDVFHEAEDIVNLILIDGFDYFSDSSTILC